MEFRLLIREMVCYAVCNCYECVSGMAEQETSLVMMAGVCFQTNTLLTVSHEIYPALSSSQLPVLRSALPLLTFTLVTTLCVGFKRGKLCNSDSLKFTLELHEQSLVVCWSKQHLKEQW